MAGGFAGVLAPVVTPFDDDLGPNAGLLAEHCRRLLDEGAGLAVFGTNSEANSLSVAERLDLLERLVADGIPASRLMPGTGCCALPDSVALTRRAVELGCGGVLMLPPFYYKGISDDGLYRSFAEVIERVGDDRLRIYLYHIPPVAQVGLSHDLIERLLGDYPGVIAGIKDSSGDWRNTAGMHERQWDGFDIFVGSETLLLDNLRAGGAGCISATANINAAAIDALYRQWQDADADERQQELTAYREKVQRFPMIPALKSVVAARSGDARWCNVRPPLIALDESQRESLHNALQP